VVFFNALRVKIRDESVVKNKAVYLVSVPKLDSAISMVKAAENRL
jgi:hypothetical protein